MGRVGRLLSTSLQHAAARVTIASMGSAGVALLAMWIALVTVWIWALVDCIRVPDDRYYRSGTKVVWVIVIVLLGLIGAVVYLLAGRPDASTRGTMGSGGGQADPPLPPPAPPGSLPPPPS